MKTMTRFTHRKKVLCRLLNQQSSAETTTVWMTVKIFKCLGCLTIQTTNAWTFYSFLAIQIRTSNAIIKLRQLSTYKP